MHDPDRTASLMTPAKLALVKPREAVSPAAWLDQMAADAGHAHVRRLAELREELRAQALRRDSTALSTGLERLAALLPQLDFSQLRKSGWWARATGKSRGAAAAFAGCFQQAEEAASALAAQGQALYQQQREQAGAGERCLVEFEVEFRALEKIMGQGTRWLHDMRAQIKARQAQAGDAASRLQIESDAARCELLVERLKALRAVSSAAQLAHQQAQGAVARHAALLKSLQGLAAEIKDWRARISTLADVAGDSNSPALNLEGPEEHHRALQLAVKQARTDCVNLHTQENAATDSLAALAVQLQAVAR